MRQGKLLPGKKIVPERIRETRAPYVAGLRAADAAWDNGDYDVSALAAYLEGLLKNQLSDATNDDAAAAAPMLSSPPPVPGN
jgi:hypothetical protein